MLDLVFIFLLAIILSTLLTWGIGWRHPGRRDAAGLSAFFLFLVLMLSMWAGAVWLRPVGPTLYGRPWLSFLATGLFVSFLILAVADPGSRRKKSSSEIEENAMFAAGAVFSIFFWFFLLVFLLTASAGYFI